MIPEDSLILLDTSILVHLDRRVQTLIGSVLSSVSIAALFAAFSFTRWVHPTRSSRLALKTDSCASSPSIFVLAGLVRGKAAGKKILGDYSLGSRPERPLISIVTVGECLALTKKFGWIQSRQDQVCEPERQLQSATPMDLPSPALYVTSHSCDLAGAKRG